MSGIDNYLKALRPETLRAICQECKYLVDLNNLIQSYHEATKNNDGANMFKIWSQLETQLRSNSNGNVENVTSLIQMMINYGAMMLNDTETTVVSVEEKAGTKACDNDECHCIQPFNKYGEEQEVIDNTKLYVYGIPTREDSTSINAQIRKFARGHHQKRIQVYYKPNKPYAIITCETHSDAANIQEAINKRPGFGTSFCVKSNHENQVEYHVRLPDEDLSRADIVSTLTVNGKIQSKKMRVSEHYAHITFDCQERADIGKKLLEDANYIVSPWINKKRESSSSSSSPQQSDQE